MESQSINKTADPTDPLLDTWAGKKDAGSWGVTPSFDFTSLSIQSVNDWHINNSMMGTLDAFDELARVWSIYFSSNPNGTKKSSKLCGIRTTALKAI